jgi:desulfoferrodoxin-like iron-binding protein
VSTVKSQVYVCCVCGNTVEVLQAGEGALVCCGIPMDRTGENDTKASEPSGGRAVPHVILGVHVTDRAHHAPGVQAVLSEYAMNIRTRLGLHDLHGDFCSPNGLILLEFIGNDDCCKRMADQLASIAGVEVKRMTFEHP